jgi:hypothetical protein
MDEQEYREMVARITEAIAHSAIVVMRSQVWKQQEQKVTADVMGIEELALPTLD